MKYPTRSGPSTVFNAANEREVSLDAAKLKAILDKMMKGVGDRYPDIASEYLAVEAVKNIRRGKAATSR